MPHSILLTIEHSGTHTILKDLGFMKNYHLNQEEYYELDLNIYKIIYTTFRDPYRIGASWANRAGIPLDKHPRVEFFTRWHNQWNEWKKVALRRNTEILNIDKFTTKLNTYPDKLNLHKAIDEKNMNYFYTYVPEHYIKQAKIFIGEVYG